MTRHAIEIDAVSKQFDGVCAVDNLSLSVPEGTTLGLLGPNGAGKSTTIKMLMGLLRTSQGRVSVLGRDVIQQHGELKRRVGYVPELQRIYGWMRVGQVLQFVRSFYPTWNHELCATMLEAGELPTSTRVRNLSKGMAVKLSLLLAVSHEPELLILDEPTSGLDPLVREEFLDGVLRTICRQPRTVLFSSHFIDDVQRLADSVAILHRGRLLVHDGIDDLLAGCQRVTAVLRDGTLPKVWPENVIWQETQRREWRLTLTHCSEQDVHQLRDRNPVESVQIEDVSLEQLFKDYIKGERIALESTPVEGLPA